MAANRLRGFSDPGQGACSGSGEIEVLLTSSLHRLVAVGPVIERRAEPRLSGLSELTIWPMEAGAAPPEPVFPLTSPLVDISRRGFGFVSGRELGRGTRLRVRFRGVYGAPVVHALVRSCVSIGERLYRVGARFTDER